MAAGALVPGDHRPRPQGLDRVQGGEPRPPALRAGLTKVLVDVWHPTPAPRPGQPHAELDQFRRQTRDLYIPAGGIGFWQGAVRDGDDVFHADLAAAIQERRRFAIELLYSDHEGGQRTVSLFSVIPRDAGDDPDQWLCAVARHWNLDRPDPR